MKTDTAACRLASLLEKPSDSRVNRFSSVRIVKLCLSTWLVHIVFSSRSPIPKTALRFVETRLHAALEELAAKIDTAYLDLAQAYANVEIMSPRKLRGLG